MLRLTIEYITINKINLQEVIMNATDKNYVTNNLLGDYKIIDYKYPEDIKSILIKDKSEEKVKVMEHSIKNEVRQLLCVAKEVFVGDEELVGYSLIFKELTVPLFELKNKKFSHSKFSKNLSKLEWVFDMERQIGRAHV